MKFKFERGEWQFSGYSWHSINVVPHAILASTCNDDGVITSRWLTVTIFGQIFNLSWPDTKRRRMREYIGTCGLAYSRKRRKWYWLGSENG